MLTVLTAQVAAIHCQHEPQLLQYSQTSLGMIQKQHKPRKSIILPVDSAAGLPGILELKIRVLVSSVSSDQKYPGRGGGGGGGGMAFPLKIKKLYIYELVLASLHERKQKGKRGVKKERERKRRNASVMYKNWAICIVPSDFLVIYCQYVHESSINYVYHPA